jgi:hypothetical protein
MSRRRPIVCMVAACLAAALSPACAARRGQQATPLVPPQCDTCTQEKLEALKDAGQNCRPKMHNEEGLLRGYQRDGMLHFRIAFDADVDPLHKQALQAAMVMWNRRSDVTGFLFEDATTDVVDISLKRGMPSTPAADKDVEPVEETSCAGYRADGSYIWYSTTNTAWLKNKTDIVDAARIYAHELGHGLNLDHRANGTSVMRQGDATADCTDLARHIIADVQASDARDAHRCGCGVRLKVQAPAATALQRK